MKRLFIIALIPLLWANLAFARHVPAKKAQPVKPHAKVRQVAEEQSKAHIVMEAVTGKVLEGENIHEKRPPASIAKLMLAYVVLDKLQKGEAKLTDKIVVSAAASKMGGSQVYLKEGEEFSLEEMMKAIMIASANDAAYAVAESLAGSSREFVALMNDKAKGLGMNDTLFQSPHGLPPSKDQTEDLTSAYDLAILGRELLKYPKLLEWTSTKSAGFRDGKFVLNNHNKLLSKMAEVDGFKTGYYRACGYGVAATAKKGDLRFIVVVLGSPAAKIRDTLVMEKLKKYFAEYTAVSLAKKGEPIDKDVILEDGRFKKIKGVVGADFSFPLLREKRKDVKRVVNLQTRVKGEVKEGQKLGEMLFQLDNETIGKVDIVSPVYVPKANLFTRIIRKIGLDI